jgi:hypothetical protein
MAVPGRNELHEQAHCDRSENAIRPDDLGTAAGGTVLARLFTDALLVEDAHAPQTMLARRREGDLATDDELVAHLVHVHADIDVRNEEASRKLLELIALGKGVHTTE